MSPRGLRRVQVITDEPFALRVVIAAPRDPVRIWTRALLLAVWAWVWVLTIPEIEDRVAAAFGIALWVMVAMLVLSSLLWYLRGAEVVDVREGVLRLTRIGGGWTRQWEYKLAEVEHVRVAAGGIAFDTAKATVLFGAGLEAEEADRLVRRLLR